MSEAPTGAPFVVVGESLIDIVTTPDGERTEAVGGSPMNVAVGLARLDVPSLLITRVGDDPHGLSVAEHLSSSGVILGPDSVVPGFRTSTATARLDEKNAASYDFDVTWDLPHQQLPEALGLHVGSLGTVLDPGREAVLDLVLQAERDGLFVSFDPNIRPAFLTDPHQAWRQLSELAARCRLVKLSDEDLEALRPGEPADQLAAELLEGAATELVIVTRGADGAQAWTSYFGVKVAAPSVAVVDTVGAGDSFTAAVLTILVDWALPSDGPGALDALDDDQVGLLLSGAMSAAAVTCSRRGANPPRRSELPPTWPA